MPGFDKVALMKYPTLEKRSTTFTTPELSGTVDGVAAACADRAKQDWPKKYGLKPRARIRATGQDRHRDPTIMLTAPFPLTEKILADQWHEHQRTSICRGQQASRPWSCALLAGVRLLMRARSNVTADSIAMRVTPLGPRPAR